MNVLILHSRYLSGAASGENRVVEDEISLLRARGHRTEAWMPTVGQHPLARISAAVDTVWSARARRFISRSTASGAFDVLHAHNLFPNISPAALRTDIPTVMTLHNFRLACLPGTLLRDGRICEECVGRGTWRGVMHACYRQSVLASAVLASSVSLHRAMHTFDEVTLFSAVSEFMRDKLEDGGLDATKVRVRPNFAWATARREGAGDYFLSLGRLSEEKGLDTVIGRWRSRWPLVVVGDGPQRVRLEALAAREVQFRGSVAAGEVGPIVRRARALLVPSRWYEGSPRAIVEALAAGVPVIASRIGGLPEHVQQNVSGLLVEPRDAEAWAQAIEHLEDDDTSERLGEGAYHAWEERFSPDIGLRSLEALYEEAIELHAEQP